MTFGLKVRDHSQTLQNPISANVVLDGVNPYLG